MDGVIKTVALAWTWTAVGTRQKTQRIRTPERTSQYDRSFLLHERRRCP